MPCGLGWGLAWGLLLSVVLGDRHKGVGGGPQPILPWETLGHIRGHFWLS